MTTSANPRLPRLAGLLRRVAAVPAGVQDAVFAALLCFGDIQSQWKSWITDHLLGEGGASWQLVTTYAALGYVALVVRRRHPEAVFATLWVHSVVGHLFLPYRPYFGLLVALYTIASRAPLRRSLVALAAMGVVTTLTVLDEIRAVPPNQRPDLAAVDTVILAAIVAAVWGAGWWVSRSRRDLLDLDRRRLAEARSAVVEERARIARELHDIVAHSVTVMVLQAAGARRLAEDASPGTRQALTDIELTGRQTMGELRRLLGVLGRGTGDDDPDPDDARTIDLTGVGPHPGLADLAPVYARVTAAGLVLDVREHGTPRPLDTSVGVAAHRVVTEGVTNALKHGGPRTRVDLYWGEEDLRIVVADDGAGRGGGAPSAGGLSGLSSGRGLLGLRERVRAVGGRLETGPDEDGGWRLVAVLPAGAVGSLAATGRGQGDDAATAAGTG